VNRIVVAPPNNRFRVDPHPAQPLPSTCLRARNLRSPSAGGVDRVPRECRVWNSCHNTAPFGVARAGNPRLRPRPAVFPLPASDYYPPCSPRIDPPSPADHHVVAAGVLEAAGLPNQVAEHLAERGVAVRDPAWGILSLPIIMIRPKRPFAAGAGELDVSVDSSGYVRPAPTWWPVLLRAEPPPRSRAGPFDQPGHARGATLDPSGADPFWILGAVAFLEVLLDPRSGESLRSRAAGRAGRATPDVGRLVELRVAPSRAGESGAGVAVQPSVCPPSRFPRGRSARAPHREKRSPCSPAPPR